MAAVTILALIFDPSVFRRYREMLRTAAIEAEFIPTVSGVLRLIFFRPYFTAQFVPMMLALVWSVWSCIKNMSNWSWRDHGLTVMVISTLTTSYGWLTDANGPLASGAVCRDVYLRQQKEISRDDTNHAGGFRVPELDDAVANRVAHTAAIGNLFLEQSAVERVVFLPPASPFRQSYLWLRSRSIGN